MKSSLYSGRHPADVAAYTIREAASLAGVSPSTLGTWTRERALTTRRGKRLSPAIIVTPEPRFLSFTNMVEAHVLAGLRKIRNIQLEKIRIAVRFVDKHFGIKHALAHEVFKTDGVDLFIEHLDVILNASLDGQSVLQGLLSDHLERVEYDHGRAIRLFPLHRQGAPRTIVVDPRRAFGRPVLAGTSVPIVDIASRFKCGDSEQQLAADYNVTVPEIMEVIRAVIKEAA